MAANTQQQTVNLSTLSTDPEYVAQQVELLEQLATRALAVGLSRAAMANSLRAAAAANGAAQHQRRQGVAGIARRRRRSIGAFTSPTKRLGCSRSS